MPEISFAVGIVVERRVIDHPWQDHAWAAVAVLPDAPAMAAWTQIYADDRVRRFYAGPAAVVLATTETANYRDNLVNPPPRLWVVLSATEAGEMPIALGAVTADPAEGEAHTESGANLVFALPMPADVAAEVARFVDAHHVERPFFKRKRKRHDESRGEA